MSAANPPIYWRQSKAKPSNSALIHWLRQCVRPPSGGKSKTNSNSRSKSDTVAIYHLHAQVIKRSAGQSSVAAAAYRLGVRLVDDRTGTTHDYTRKGGVDGFAMFAPANAPDWALDPGQLWNRAEAAEKRKDAQPAREVEVSLPRELTPEQRAALVEDFVRENFVSEGMVACVGFHKQDSDNPHAHIMLTMRRLSPDGAGFEATKAREWNDVERLEGWRASWAECANRALAQAARPERIDHRSLKDQGIDREPTTHRGPRAQHMARRGLSDRLRGWAAAVAAAVPALGQALRHRRSRLNVRAFEAGAEAPSPPPPPGRRPGPRR